MQIDEVKIVGWLWNGLVVLSGLVATLLLFIWRGDRTRLKNLEVKNAILEEKMTHVVTMPQVEHIVENVKKEFKEANEPILNGQKSIMIVIDNRQEELKDYIRDMFDAREGKWNGRNRRKQ